MLVGRQLVIGELQRGPFQLDDLLQLLGHPLEGSGQSHAGQLRLPGPAQAFLERPQAFEATVDSPLEQVLDGFGGVDAVQQVVSDLGQDLVGRQVRPPRVLGTAPPAVPDRAGHGCT